MNQQLKESLEEFDKKFNCEPTVHNTENITSRDFLTTHIKKLLQAEIEFLEKLPTLNLESFIAETKNEVRGMDNAKRLVDKDRILSHLQEQISKIKE